MSRRIERRPSPPASQQPTPDPAGPAATSPTLAEPGPLLLRPLTARSVLLSVLLGTHPPELPVRSLIRTGALFDIPEGTVRVALSRMAADGDVIATGGRYRLAPRLLARQLRQDEGRAADTRPWEGGWELLVADPGPPAASRRAGLVEAAVALRMAAWREGVWGRPANLDRTSPPPRPEGARRVTTGPLESPGALASSLWDLYGWAAQARHLVRAMDAAPDPATHFSVSAVAVQHLRDDPLLPGELLPPAWPGEDLRTRYRSFEAELTNLLRAG